MFKNLSEFARAVQNAANDPGPDSRGGYPVYPDWQQRIKDANPDYTPEQLAETIRYLEKIIVPAKPIHHD